MNAHEILMEAARLAQFHLGWNTRIDTNSYASWLSNEPVNGDWSHDYCIRTARGDDLERATYILDKVKSYIASDRFIVP